MKLRSFIYLMGVVALVAVIYSPSTIGVGAGSNLGSTTPADTASAGTSKLLHFLKSSGYHVVLVNDSQTEQNQIGSGRRTLLLIGADTPLAAAESLSIQNHYRSGTLSLLLAEGNTTNSALVSSLFGANVSGAAVVDPASPFQDKRVLSVVATLGTARVSGVLDIASPIRFLSNTLASSASTSALSYDTADHTVGPRNVIAVGSTTTGARSLVVTDSAPFTNYLFDYTATADETSFVSSMISWVTQSNKSVPILFDNFHYRSYTPKFSFKLPIGPLVTYILELQLQSVDNYYSSLPSNGTSFLQRFGIPISDSLLQAIIAVIVLSSIYGAVKRWFAQEKTGKDDQPHPNIERLVVAESKARLDFLKTSRSKSFYVATVARLYEVIDEIMTREFGSGISALSREQLIQKLGDTRGEEASKLLLELRRIYAYANGQRRFLFPPVLRWKSKVAGLTERAERFLNEIGMTIAGEEPTKKRVEYAIGRR